MRIDPKDVQDARLDAHAIKVLAELLIQRIQEDGSVLGAEGFWLDLNAIEAMVRSLRNYPVIETNEPSDVPAPATDED
jgi:hypothetical protein